MPRLDSLHCVMGQFLIGHFPAAARVHRSRLGTCIEGPGGTTPKLVAAILYVRIFGRDEG